MFSLLSVALGGALGASLRYLTGLAVGFPYGTLSVNVAGSLAIGVLAVYLLGNKGNSAAAPFLITGVLGGFTTFSAFSLDTIRLLEQGRTGAALAYVLASVGLSVLACAAGYTLAKGAAA